MITALTSSALFQSAPAASELTAWGGGKLANLEVARCLGNLSLMIGARAAARLLQMAVNENMQGDVLEVDGVIGPKSLNAINMSGVALYEVFHRIASQVYTPAA